MMIRNESYVIRKEQCPACRKLGNDKSMDNLAVYSDGHSYCFRCGFGTGRNYFTQTVAKPESAVILPADITTEFPAEAKRYLGKYSISRLDIQQHHIMWSEKWSRVIFPYFDDTGLIAWQGRYLGEDAKKAKWFSQGKIHEIIHPIKVTQREACLVEDILSAIRVSSICGAIPIFGSSISTKQWLRLRTVVDRVYLFLDPDMRIKSVKMMSVGNLVGIDTHVIFSDKDPKDHSHEELTDILREAKTKTLANANPLLPILPS